MRFLSLLSFLFIAALSSATNVPNYTGYVNDYANVLTAEQRVTLENHLRQNENAGGWQIAVVTVPNLQGESVEEFANDLFTKWGIGRKHVDDGVLILLSMNPRKIRIEVGRGNEGDLTDVQCIRIIREIIVPQLKSGNIYNGLSSGVDSIIGSQPRKFTEEEKAAQAKQSQEQAIVNAKIAQDQKIQAIQDGWKREQDAKTKKLTDERFWNSFKDTCYGILLWIIFTLPVTGWLGYRLFIRLKEKHRIKLEEKEKKRVIDETKRKEQERLEAIAEAKHRKEQAEERARQIERQRIADEKERQWRKDNPEKAKEKDRLAQIAIATAAALALEESIRRRKREDDEEESRRRSSYSSSDSSSSFGGFGGGSSAGGGASSDW